VSYDPNLDGDPSLLLAVFAGAFAGHVRKDTVVVETIEPGVKPWLPRATAIILLDRNQPGSRCGIVDLLHPSERGTPRCGDPNCRCMLLAAEVTP
jgi:hypothetical protein